MNKNNNLERVQALKFNLEGQLFVIGRTKEKLSPTWKNLPKKTLI